MTVESRLTATLLALAERGEFRTTQGNLATRTRTAREAVTRRLAHFARR